MHTFITVLLAVSAVCVTASDVLDLGDADFDSKLADIDTALVMFYAPWCGHCKKMKPEFDKCSGDLLANDPPVHLVKVDCTEAGKDTCGRFEVKGYPTLKIFRNGELSSDYNGPREAAGITKFMKSQVGPASKEITTVAAADAILAKGQVVIFAFGPADSTIQQTFAKTAAKLREEYTFAHTSAEEVMTKLGQKEGVAMFRPKHLQNKFEESILAYTGSESDKGALATFIADNIQGLCGHRTADNAKDFKMPLVVAYYGVDYAKNIKGTNYWRNRVLKVGKEFSGFNYAISNKDDFMQELSEYGFEHMAGDKPVVAARDAQGLKYKMTPEFDMENFKDFLTQFEAGNIDPWIKSEAVPDNSANSVKVAVAKNFDELVTNSEKDVLVEFYAPWCGHCKKLTPIFEELGDKMAEEAVEIVKMDATANDVPPQFEVKGFPTLFWIPKGGKPESYNGGREVDDFVKYIAENASNELKGYSRKGKEKTTEL